MVWVKLTGLDKKINLKRETLNWAIRICASNCKKFKKCEDRWECISGVLQGFWSFEVCKALHKLEKEGLVKIERLKNENVV